MQEGEKWLRACKLVLGLHVDYQYRFMRFEQQSEEAAAHNEAEYTAGVGAWEQQVAETKQANKQTRITAKDAHEAHAQAATERDEQIEHTIQANQQLFTQRLAAFSTACETVVNDNRTRVLAGAAVFASQVPSRFVRCLFR